MRFRPIWFTQTHFDIYISLTQEGRESETSFSWCLLWFSTDVARKPKQFTYPIAKISLSIYILYLCGFISSMADVVRLSFNSFGVSSSVLASFSSSLNSVQPGVPTNQKSYKRILSSASGIVTRFAFKPTKQFDSLKVQVLFVNNYSVFGPCELELQLFEYCF